MNRLIHISIFLIACILQSCQIEDDATPSPQDAYIRYYGELTSYEAKDLEIQFQGGEPSALVVLGTKLSESGDNDIFLLRTDLEGNPIDSISFGLNAIIDPDGDGISNFDLNENGSLDEGDVIRGDDYPQKMVFTNEAILIVGYSSITENIPETELTPARQITDWRQLILARVPLGVDLNTLDRSTIPVLPVAAVRDREDPNNTVLDLEGHDIIQLADGGILMVGTREVDRNGSSDFDSYLVKLERGSDFIDFEKSIGVAGIGEDEEAIRVFEKANGNLVLIGSGNTNSRLGENGGENGVNAYFIELDQNGTPINRRYYGVESSDDANTAVYNEQVTNAIEVPSGFIIVGTSTTSQNERFGFAISLTHSGEHLGNASLPSETFNTGGIGLETSILGVTQARDNDLILVGKYPGFVSDNIGKDGEALFMKVDQSLVLIPESESNFGLTDGNDEFVDAVTLTDGSIVAAGNIDFGAGTKLISIIKLNDTGNLEN